MSVTDDRLRTLTAHELIKDQLRRQIGDLWPVGTRLPPIKELARHLNSGQSNTHRAVKELAGEGLLSSRQRRGTFVIRVAPPDGSPQRLAGVRLDDKHVTLLHWGAEPEGFIAAMMTACRDALCAAGCQVGERGIGNVRPEIDLADIGDGAMIFFNPGVRSLIRFGPRQLLAIATTSSHLRIAASTRYDLVTVDQHQGGRLAGVTLAQAKCRDACFIGCAGDRPATGYDALSSERLTGFESGFERSILERHRLRAAHYSIAGGRDAAADYLKLKPRPSGIFAASDDLAVGFVRAVDAKGLKAGRDFHIVGFDGQARGRLLRGGPLTTVQAPAALMGKRAAQLLAERFADPDQPASQLYLGCSLFAGSTVRVQTARAAAR